MNYYTIKGNTTCLITNYDDNLVTLMKSWIDDGYQIILMIDENEALQKNTLDNFCRKTEDIGRKGLILNHHSSLKIPTTRSPGTNTIDVIFGTESLVVNKAGYRPIFGFTDQIIAWVDVN